MIRERVKIILDVVAKDSEKEIKHFNKQLARTRPIQKDNNLVAKKGSVVMSRFRQNFRGLSTVMGMSSKQFNKVSTGIKAGTTGIRELSNGGARFANTIRRAMSGLKGFKMEMLGVMFFGMAMQRMFTGLLKPSAQLVGLFDLWKTTLQVLFLPLSLLLMNFLMPLFIWLMSLDDGTKLFIGKLVLLGAAIGTILFVVGTLALGIGSMVVAFGSVFTIIDKLIPDLRVGGVNLSSFLEAALGITLVSAAFGGFRNIIKGVLDRLMKLDVIKELFSKLGIEVDDSLSAWDNFKLLFGAGIDKIKEKLGLGKDSAVMTANNLISKTLEDIKTKFTEMKELVKAELEDMGITGEGGIIESFKLMSETATDMLPSLKTLATSLKVIADVLTTIVDAFKYIKENNIIVRTGAMIDSIINKRRSDKFDEFQNLPVGESLGGNSLNDFIMMPGQSPAAFSPDDTIVGFKGNSPMGATINQTLNINARSDQDVRRVVDLANASLLSKLQRNMG